jgi:hypothetical protein
MSKPSTRSITWTLECCAHWLRVIKIRERRLGVTASAYAELEETGTDPGPLVSGIESDQFPEETKNRLRELSREWSDESDRAFRAWKAGGRRRLTYLRVRESFEAIHGKPGYLSCYR